MIPIPTSPEYVEQLIACPPLVGAVLLAGGAVYLAFGWRIFKILVIVNAALLGVFCGHWVGTRLSHPHMDIILGIAGALILGAAAWPLMKFAVSLMGALAGAAVGFALWKYIAQATGLEQYTGLAWVGALIGLITMGLLAFIIFKAVVMIFTSLQGSSLAVTGLLALLVKSESLQPRITSSLNENPHLVPLAILVPAIIGVIFQESRYGKHHKVKK